MKNRDENFCLGTSSFGEGLGISPPQLRSTGEIMAEIDKSRAAIIENERWGLLRKKMVSMIADAGTDDSAVMQAIENERCRALTAPNRVPNHNNQLLLLL